ncbi:hypothetical protein LLG95_02190 [bacterium]|nr:hypothetical protein [bacterium]
MPAKRALIILLAFVLALPAWSASVRRAQRTRSSRQQTTEKPAAETAQREPDANSFESFALITQRNIFDPTRTPYRSSSASAATNVATPVADTIDLLGVLIDSGKSVAFTEGSSSDYKRTLEPGMTIAGMKVAAISTDGLKMESGSQTIDWPVGKRIERREGKGWELVDSPRFSVSSTPRQTLAQSRPQGNRGDGSFGGSRGGYSGGNSGYDSGGSRRDRGYSGQSSSNQQRPTQASTGQSSGASTQDIMARLRERRLREMGQ